MSIGGTQVVIVGSLIRLQSASEPVRLQRFLPSPFRFMDQPHLMMSRPVARRQGTGLLQFVRGSIIALQMIEGLASTVVEVRIIGLDLQGTAVLVEGLLPPLQGGEGIGVIRAPLRVIWREHHRLTQMAHGLLWLPEMLVGQPKAMVVGRVCGFEGQGLGVGIDGLPRPPGDLAQAPQLVSPGRLGGRRLPRETRRFSHLIDALVVGVPLRRAVPVAHQTEGLLHVSDGLLRAPQVTEHDRGVAMERSPLLVELNRLLQGMERLAVPAPLPVGTADLLKHAGAIHFAIERPLEFFESLLEAPQLIQGDAGLVQAVTIIRHACQPSLEGSEGLPVAFLAAQGPTELTRDPGVETVRLTQSRVKLVRGPAVIAGLKLRHGQLVMMSNPVLLHLNVDHQTLLKHRQHPKGSQTENQAG